MGKIIAASCCLLALATFAAYHNSFAGPFVFDDAQAITGNPTIRQLSPISAVLSPPGGTGVTVNGRPLVNLSLALNYAFGGLSVRGYHVFNVMIHILAGLTLFGVVRRTLLLPLLTERFGEKAWPAALAVAALWTLHPLNTESVTYVIQRAESMVGLWYLLTLYAFIRSSASPRPGVWQGLSAAACLLGMATKEVMVTAPLLVLLYDRAFVSGTFRESWRRHAALYAGLASTWLLLGWLVAGSGDRGGTAGFGAGGISWWHYALTQCRGIVHYLRLSFWPRGLVFDYGVDLDRNFIAVAPQAVALVMLLAATLWALWRRPVFGFLGAWFFAILAPSSSILPISSEVLAEHRMYLPLAAVLSLPVLVTFSRLGRPVLIVYLSLAGLAGVLTFQRNEIYRDELALWRDTVANRPENARAHNNLGEVLSREDAHKAEAVECYRRAVRLQPNYIDAINNLGNILARLGHSEEGIGYLERSLQLNPNSAETNYYLGHVFDQLDRNNEAATHFLRALELKPRYQQAHNDLGVVLGRLGRTTEAVWHFETALGLKPDDAEAHYNLGNTLAQVGRMAEAVTHFQRALEIKPGFPEAQNNLGNALFQQGKFPQAMKHYEQALGLDPGFAEAHNNYGTALFETGRLAEAIEHFEQALRIDAGFTNARNNLELTRRTQKTTAPRP